MRTEACKNCGKTEYKQYGNVYVCKYCRTEYIEEPQKQGAIQSILGFTERQMDKFRQNKKEKDIKKGYQRAGLCQHCGNRFTGFFKKNCSVCGKPKDY